MRLYLAPHHDDALLSMPARLCWASRRRPVSLVVLFSNEDEQLEMICRNLHHRLRVTVHELGLTEARRRGVSLRQCLRRSRSDQDLDRAEVERVSRRLLPMIEDLSVTELVAPSTMIHIDHALTRSAAEWLLSQGHVKRLAYQADQPYATLWPVAVRVNGAIVSREEGAAPRLEVVQILEQLGSHIGARDVRRILMNYHEPECRVEPLWFPSGRMEKGEANDG